MELPADVADLDFCYLTTTGRRSGRPHTIEIWFVAEGSSVHMLAGGGPAADWVRNLTEDPAVSVRIADVEYAGLATVVVDDRERARVAALVHAKYQPRYAGDLGAWRDSALPVTIALAD